MSSPQIVGTVFIAIAFVLIGYFLGSILFGAIIANRFKKDLRNIASGNVGATNVIRVVGKGMGLSVMFLDAIKGYAAIAICLLIYHFSIGKWAPANHNGQNICLILVYLSGTFAVIGHCYPIQYVIALFKFKGDKEQARKYKGGKGVATAGGVLFAVSPWLGLIAFLLFMVMLLIFRHVSLGSMTGMALAVIFVWVPKVMFLYVFDPHWTIDWDWQYKLVIMILLLYNAIIVIFRHKENIARIMNREERKVF